MLNELSGDLIFKRDQRPVANFAGKMLDTFVTAVENLTVTHYAAGYEPAFNWIPLTDGRLTSILASDYEYIAFACFADDCDINNEIGLHWKMAINGFHFRQMACLILKAGCSMEMVSTQLTSVIKLWDSWCIAFEAQSGHVHDLADISDQNEEGPFWFELTGKQLPANKIKYNPVTGEHDVDIEQNPCHTHVVGTVDFTAAWTNYLGPDYLAHLGFSRAIDLVPIVEEISHEVVILSNSLVRVTLFEDPYAFGRPENIDRIWEFRRRLRIDEVAHRLDTHFARR